MRDHLCPIHFSGFFSRFQGGFNFVFESESCIFLFFFLVKFSCMCVSVFFLCRWFQVRHLDRVFLLLFLSISSHWPAWWDCVLTLEVLRDGEDGPCSTIFATCQSTLSSSRFTCVVVLMKATVLSYSMSCLALIWRRIWPAYRRYLITLWFPLWLVRLREFWGGRETKKILSPWRCWKLWRNSN